MTTDNTLRSGLRRQSGPCLGGSAAGGCPSAGFPFVHPRLGDSLRRLFEAARDGLLILDHPSSQYQGTGIGLTIVRKAVERMRAQLGLEFELGKGSQFWIQQMKG